MESNTSFSEYIDIDDALARIGGNIALYKRLLGRFLEGKHLEDIKNAIESGDLEEAARQSHTLKGVSANLSLLIINKLTIELEHLIKDGADFSACLSELEEAYENTTVKITELSEQP